MIWKTLFIVKTLTEHTTITH